MVNDWNKPRSIKQKSLVWGGRMKARKPGFLSSSVAGNVLFDIAVFEVDASLK